MGVQGLWELLTPIGRRVSVDSLGNRKLAIDASIWIIQFMKAMRDENGDMVRNAHLLGFFRRICKLLYLRIKPVFVFDGGTPILKRRTVIARRRQRENAQFKIRKTAEKLLLNHIRSRKLEEIASEINSGPRKAPSEVVETDVKPIAAEVLQGSGGSDAQFDSRGSSFNQNSDQEAADALLAASLAAEYSQDTKPQRELAEEIIEASDGDDDVVELAASLAAEYSQDTKPQRELAEEIIEASDGDDDVEELVLPSNVKGLDPAVLASLPASMQLELLVQMREQLVAENRQKFQKVSKVPSSFSQLQIQAYLKTVAFRREITEVQKASAGVGVGGVPTTRIASTSDREFIFSNSFQGEKPAPSSVEQQRRSKHGTSGAGKELPGSFLGSKSTLFSSVTKNQKSPLEKIPEEGVISLVSTELNEEPDSNSNSAVHTYVDGRGHVRVNRARGMGVRMTRDLQWNLYLMKDTEARKTSEHGSSSDSPIIQPSDPVVDSPSSTVNNVINSSASTQGLQISFVDDGNFDFSKDGDFFEELVMSNGKDENVTNFQGSRFPESDENVRVTNTEVEDDYEWEEGGAEKGLDCNAVEENIDILQGAEGSTLASIREDQNSGYGKVPHKEEEGQDEPWEDGGLDRGVDYSVVEDKELAEAMKLSLMMQDEPVNTEEPNDHIIIEEGPSSDESEVEWEDGTGAVTVTGFDAVSNNTDTSKIESGPSEEAQIQEAIRRSLEDFCPPAKLSSRLVIKEPSEGNSISMSKGSVTLSPLVRAEAESEETYLARERTRKGKALLGEDENVSHHYASNIPQMNTVELENCADTTFIKTTCNEDALQTLARVSEKNWSYGEKQVGETVTEPSIVVKDEPVHYGYAHGSVPVSEPIGITHAAFAPGTTETTLSSAGNLKVSPFLDADTSPSSSDNKNVRLERSSVVAAACPISHDEATLVTVRNTEDINTGFRDRFDYQKSTKAPVYLSESWPSNEEELLRDAEEMDIAKEREELQLREAEVLREREQLAREEEQLQAELEAEREEIQAGLDRERELLAREEMELRASQKKNERNAEHVTGEMFTDVQELLQLFGLPYVVAPMEAEAQCAYMDTIKLVDGVVTEDSDVFLFGGRSVYKNLFDDRKYVETYYMEDLETEMGMTREKLIRMALLLGSDYTEGISGIGIVNAIEVVNSFDEEDGLRRFKEWLDSPDMSLFNRVVEQTKVKGGGKGGRVKGKAVEGEGEHIEEDEVSEGGDLDESEDSRFTPRQRIFINKHRAVSKNWNIPDSFPSEAVIAAYISPMVDKSKESFSFGRPDLEALRGFCYDKFSWNKDKADELLLPVLKEYDRREIQTRMDSYYHFSQRFAKIRSRRIQKAVVGITGRRSDELMELPPHLVMPSPAKKSVKRSKTSTTSELDEEINRLSGINKPSSLLDEEPVSTADGGVTRVARGGRGRRGRGRGRGRDQNLATAGDVEDEEDGENGEDETNITNRKTRGRGRGRGRETGKSSTRDRSSKGRGKGRGRGRGRARGDDSEADACNSDASKSDEVTEDYMGEVESLKRKASQISPVSRRSTRRVSEVNYMVDNSDEEAGGTCSDGEEVQAAKLRESATFQDIPDLQGPHASSSEPSKGVSSMDVDRPVRTGLSKGSLYEEGGGFCREDGEGSEEPGQLHFETEQPAYLARGGGFCADEDEETPEDLERGISGEIHQEQQPTFTLGGGFCLVKDEEEALAKAIEIAEQNYRNQLTQSRMENQDLSHMVTSNNPRSHRQGTDDVAPPMTQPDESGEPVELGLRAMPMMRRKKRKSG